MIRGVIGCGAVIAAVSMAAGQAAGAVVVHDNSAGTFKWTLGLHDVDGSEIPGTFLDITQPPTQDSHRRAGAFGKWYWPNQSSSSPGTRRLLGEAGAEIAKTSEKIDILWKDSVFQVMPPRDYDPGEPVTTHDNWSHFAVPYFWHLPFSVDLNTGTPGFDKDVYLGLRVKLTDNQWHYGWIHFIDYYNPVMWAYETEPNVPISISVPSPAIGTSILMLTLGACVQRRR